MFCPPLSQPLEYNFTHFSFSLHKYILAKICNTSQKYTISGFPGGAVVENPPANAGDTGSCPGPGGSHMPRSN